MATVTALDIRRLLLHAEAWRRTMAGGEAFLCLSETYRGDELDGPRDEDGDLDADFMVAESRRAYQTIADLADLLVPADGATE